LDDIGSSHKWMEINLIYDWFMSFFK
jgi:hypothetical protein